MCDAMSLQSSQESQVNAFRYGGGREVAHSGLKVDGARRSKGSRRAQEETVEAWVGP